jgi:hypothetical protein
VSSQDVVVVDPPADPPLVFVQPDGMPIVVVNPPSAPPVVSLQPQTPDVV